MFHHSEAPSSSRSEARTAGSNVASATQVPKEKSVVIEGFHLPAIRDLVMEASTAATIDERDKAAHLLVGYIGSMIDYRPWRRQADGGDR